LSIAALSFLGIGLPPDVPSWGASLSAAQQYIYVGWWIAVFPGLAILLTVLGLVLIGDGLRDVFDPRAKRN
jgi:peptide/nickel transport system permease protein